MVYALFTYSGLDEKHPLLFRSPTINSKLDSFSFYQGKWQILPENIRMFEIEELFTDAKTGLICVTESLQELAGHLTGMLESELVNKVIASVI